MPLREPKHATGNIPWPLPHSRGCSRALLSLCLLLTPWCVRQSAAQAPVPPTAAETNQTSALPVFDVISVKPHKPGDGMVRVNFSVSSYEATNLPLKDLIANAFNVRNWLVFGLPPWAESARFDVLAKVSEPDMAVMKNLTVDQRRAMLKTVLTERFGLVGHAETRTLPVYELSVLPDGPLFHESPPPPPPADGEAPTKRDTSWSTNNHHLTAKVVGMANFAENLSYIVERFVVDRTGLTGAYELQMEWMPEDQAGKAVDNGLPQSQAPPIFTALKEQLGLKLTPAKGPVPTAVIDRIVQPEPN